MVNAFRTLLLNIDGPPDFLVGIPGEEVVPPDYRAVPLPPWLKSIRAVLFGSRPDRAMLNYRLQQFLSVLHATELDEHVRSFDPRLTYWPLRRQDFFTDAFFYRATAGTGAPATLYLLGTPQADEAGGRLSWSWQVRLDLHEAQVTRLTPDPQGGPVTTALSYTSGLSQPVLLPGTRLSFQVTAQQALWQIDALARPRRGLADILQDLETLLDGGLGGDLFGPTTEPDETYRQLWYKDDRDLYRLGAVLLAVARRTQELQEAGA